MRCVFLYNQGKEFKEIPLELNVHWQSVRKYINEYIMGGFEQLCKRVERKQPSQLSELQMSDFKEVVLNKRPSEVGLKGNIWTGNEMKAYLKATYGVVYKSGIYDLLERLNLSHQKAHFDYGNADKDKQKAFVTDLKEQLLVADDTTAVLIYDEFSISERPTSYYGWAEKNTRPLVVTNEKNVQD
ncbi:MAG: winged helix-turn-helix domain-containing protein [Sphingobacteriales bacterium]|nr:winged helix-turn-helix domain-containing protein [Sphingobacteriales bacterium]